MGIVIVLGVLDVILVVLLVSQIRCYKAARSLSREVDRSISTRCSGAKEE
jgi:hypothetical protein